MSKNKKYTFNTSAFKKFVDEKRTTPTTVSKSVGKVNGYWGKKCYNGDSMEAETMCTLCNLYELSPLMFFCENGTPMENLYQKPETKSVPEEEQNLFSPKSVQDYERKMAQMQIDHKDELHRAELAHLEELSDIREQIRKEMKAEMEADRIRIEERYEEKLNREEERYEEKLNRKDEQIAQLIRDLTDLQAQYKELELAGRNTGGFSYPHGLAEPKENYLSK